MLLDNARLKKCAVGKKLMQMLDVAEGKGEKLSSKAGLSTLVASIFLILPR